MDISPSLFLVKHMGYASSARIRSEYEINAWMYSSGMYPRQLLMHTHVEAGAGVCVTSGDEVMQEPAPVLSAWMP